MVKLARLRGGQFLSEEFSGVNEIYKWKCIAKHQWPARGYSILAGGWCPKCPSKFSERLCRVYLEQIFNTSFICCRPKWLLNSRGNKMELDGYSKELNIAFEHQGMQHYKQVSIFTYNLEQRQLDDIRKKRLCEEKGVRLIIIPALFALTKLEDLPTVVQKECERLGIAVKCPDLNSIDMTEAYSPIQKGFFDEIKQIIKNKKGLLLTQYYPGVMGAVEVRCKDGHQWKTALVRLRRGQWCRICSGKAKKNYQWLVELALNRGGEVMTDHYINIHTKVKWKCKYGHIWEAPPYSIRDGKWCIKCAGLAKKDVAWLKKLALDNNGQCLSSEYVNCATKVSWKCEFDHIWDATPNQISRGHWCPFCKGVARKNLNWLYQLADKNRGICLAEQYTNTKTKVLWQCEKGHRWTATANSVQRGHWCRECVFAKQKKDLTWLHELATKRDGTSLAEIYINTQTKTKWKCRRGHLWMARPAQIAQGRWCPECWKIKDY